MNHLAAYARLAPGLIRTSRVVAAGITAQIKTNPVPLIEGGCLRDFVAPRLEGLVKCQIFKRPLFFENQRGWASYVHNYLRPL